MSSDKQTKELVTPKKRTRGRAAQILENPPIPESKRNSKSTSEKSSEKKTPAKKTPVRKRVKTIETESESDQVESENDQDSDDEFKPETDKSESESEVTELEEEEEYSKEEEVSPKKSRRTRSQKLELPENSEENTPIFDEFNKDQKITEWEYEIDTETKVFQKPKLPNLSDNAIKPFISSKSKPPKVIIYECPFCVRAFTYTLVFKSHLYSCEQNKNIPEYILFCVRCDFKSKKKQDMVNHYTDEHLKETSFISDDDSNSKFELTTCKKNQLNAANFLFVDNVVFKFTKDYFRFLFEKNSNLKKVDELTDQGISSEITIDFDSKYLKFDFLKSEICLKGFETHQFKSERYDFKILNLVDQITSFDWCPLNNTTVNYLAVSTIPNEELLTSLLGSHTNNFKTLLELETSPNLIHIYKFPDLNNPNEKPSSFAILNRKIGHVSHLKFRPDFGKSNFLNPEFIGYLLACGSDGNGYVYRAKDMTNNGSKLNVYEPEKQVILKPCFSYGQCTSGDWSHLNGSVQIALGYSNGSVAIYQLNSKCLENQNFEDTVRPVRVINAHFTFVKTIKWAKFNSSLLFTGSVFSREIKVWNMENLDKCLIEYEVFSTDFDLSLHSNDLYISKEINLKGENHMIALNLEFNLFNSEKDESRAHSSLFYTNSTMNSIDQSDYFNKFLLCDNDGSIILCRSDNSKYWVQKNKLMCNTFSRIAKFDVTIENEEQNKENVYNLEKLNKKKMSRKISINLDHANLKPGSKQTSTQLNTIEINLNSLSKIKWNPNLNYLNWYACSSVSGFLFIQKIKELDN